MSRQPDIWWNKQKCSWCTDLGGHRKVLAKGKGKKKQAQDNRISCVPSWTNNPCLPQLGGR